MLRRPPASLPWILIACTVLPCCSKDPDPPLATGVIGDAGGTLQATTGSWAGTAVDIPAGALTGDATISLFADRATTERAIDIVGPATRFSPIGLQLAQDATFTVRLDAATLPPGTVESDVAVTARAGNAGALTRITPTSVDLVAGRVIFATDQLEVFWVTARTAYPIDRYLVLGDGDHYEFDGGNSIEVSSTSSEPNFDGRMIWRYRVLMPWFARTGIYLDHDPMTGGLLFLGQFDSPSGMPATQEVADMEFELLREIGRVGDQASASYSYTGYEINLPNPPAQIYTGTGDVMTAIVEEVSVSTQIGRFDPVLVVEFESSYADTRPEAGSGRTRLWLARDVGPVMIQNDDDPPQRLVRAVVGGRIISGS